LLVCLYLCELTSLSVLAWAAAKAALSALA
jgi:hypothetical protein